MTLDRDYPASTGTASRYFTQFEPDPFVYIAKASRRDRSSGGAVVNTHPTCKSQALMRWLCRLITPPAGIVLDPFAGSGSTGVAALSEGFRFVGVEREPEYATIARARLTHASDDKRAVAFAAVADAYGPAAAIRTVTALDERREQPRQLFMFATGAL